MLQFIYISYILLVIFLSVIPVSTAGGVSYLDKVAHAVAYCVMGVLAYISVENMNKRVLLFIFMFLLGIALEFFQIYIPGRDSSAYDAMANTAGLVLSFLMCWSFPLFFKWFSARQ